LRVRDVIDDPDTTSAKLADIIATDPALSTHLLKVSNIALHPGQYPVESLKMAVSRLGLTIHAKVYFGHPSPSKRQKLNMTLYAFGSPAIHVDQRMQKP
jgi:hypothetical protein